MNQFRSERWSCLITILGLAGTGVLVPAAGWSQAASSADEPGVLVDVGDFRLYLHCLGDVPPTVVIDAGAGSWSISYRHIQEDLAKTARTCVYDRAGLGRSDKGPEPRSSERVADELRRLLHAAGIAPPYILVGHSFGGYNVRLFASRYGEEVAGIVLAESAHEAQWSRLPPEAWQLVEAQVAQLPAVVEAARAGKLDASAVSGEDFSVHNTELRSIYEAAMLTAKPYEGILAELMAVARSTTEVAQTGSLGDLPLVVVSARNSFAAFEGTGIPLGPANEAWMSMQRELTVLSTNSLHLVSETGDHRIHLSDPELLVHGVRHVVSQVRGDSEARSMEGRPR